MSKIHRTIYEEHYGPIPKEPNGRSYHIHHIDGDHSNNAPQNLVAVTAEEHHRIHQEQEDYFACLLLKSQHLSSTPEERSELSRLGALQRVADGTHHWKSDEHKEAQRQRMLKKAEDGLHPFLGGKIQSVSAKAMVLDGRHAWVGPEGNQKMIENGTHASRIRICCLSCHKEVDAANYKRWHGSNCRA